MWSHASLWNVISAFAAPAGNDHPKGDVFRSVSRWWMLVGEQGSAGGREHPSRQGEVVVAIVTPVCWSVYQPRGRRGKCYPCTRGRYPPPSRSSIHRPRWRRRRRLQSRESGRYASPSVVRQNRQLRHIPWNSEFFRIHRESVCLGGQLKQFLHQSSNGIVWPRIYVQIFLIVLVYLSCR